jgi:hypothetical protein
MLFNVLGVPRLNEPPPCRSSVFDPPPPSMLSFELSVFGVGATIVSLPTPALIATFEVASV